MPEPPLPHSSHDYRILVQQWKVFAQKAGLRMKEFVKTGDWPVFFVESPVPKGANDAPWHYISAGVHGDESAPPWGLLAWAQQNIALLKSKPFLMFPALNPHGLVLNTRADHRGVDINRAFNNPDDPLIAAWLKVVGDRRFLLSLHLHEDYDGQGCYLYELTHRRGSIAAPILRDTSRILPTDTRKRIDGRIAKNGIIMRRVPPDLPGYPEAIMLHYMGAPIALTFESPSEFCLNDRIAVQRQFIASAIRHACVVG